MKKWFLLILLISGLLVSAVWAGGVTLEPSKDLTAISWLAKDTIKVALVTKKDAFYKVSLGTYNLRPISFKAKEVYLKENKIYLLEFKLCQKEINKKLTTADTIFVYRKDSKNPVKMCYIQELHRAVNYYHCNSYLLASGQKTNIFLSFEKQPKDSVFLFARKPYLKLRAYKKLKLVSDFILKKFPAECAKEIRVGLKDNWGFYGAGRMLFTLTAPNVSDFSVFSLKIKQYALAGKGYTAGGLSAPVILIYNPNKYRVVKL